MGTDSKSRIVSIDPGTRFLGWAYFERKQLIECGLIKGQGLADMLDRCYQRMPDIVSVFKPTKHVVIEIPQVYVQRKMKGDANDLIKIALVAGYIGSLFNSVDFVLPRTWKGTVDKDVMCKRVLDRWMNDRERVLLASKGIPKGQINNTIDAIGVGMHWLGRHR